MKELDWDKINLEMLNEIDSENFDIKNDIKSEDSKSEDEVGEYFEKKHHEPYFNRQTQDQCLIDHNLKHINCMLGVLVVVGVKQIRIK